jgi:hypothetical protein
MKPSTGDHRHRLLISGDELRELQRHTGSMAEAFGLDRKIENYKGTRPITLFRWDLDCLMDVIDLALRDERDYPDRSAPGYLALKSLGERLHQEYDAVYGHESPGMPRRSRGEVGPDRRGRADDGITRRSGVRLRLDRLWLAGLSNPPSANTRRRQECSNLQSGDP